MTKVRLLFCCLAAVSAPLLVACDPPPSPVTFTVNTTAEGADVAPGDGVCEMTAGSADCSVQAALDEVDALGAAGAPGGAVVTVPAGDYDLRVPTTVTAPDVEVVGSGVAETRIEMALLEVGVGSSLGLTDLTAMRIDGGVSVRGISVQGTLVARRAALFSATSIVNVQPGGVFLGRDSTVRGGLTTPVITNEGTTVLDHVSLEALATTSALVTSGAGTAVLRSSALVAPGARWPPGTGQACGGTQPISLGYNSAWGTSCSLTGPGDQVGVNPHDDATRAPLIDKIPAGVNGCGDPGDMDVNGVARPIDGDGVDGPACDIGATEYPAP